MSWNFGCLESQKLARLVVCMVEYYVVGNVLELALSCFGITSIQNCLCWQLLGMLFNGGFWWHHSSCIVFSFGDLVFVFDGISATNEFCHYKFSFCPFLKPLLLNLLLFTPILVLCIDQCLVCYHVTHVQQTSKVCLFILFMLLSDGIEGMLLVLLNFVMIIFLSYFFSSGVLLMT